MMIFEFKPPYLVREIEPTVDEHGQLWRSYEAVPGSFHYLTVGTCMGSDVVTFQVDTDNVGDSINVDPRSVW